MFYKNIGLSMQTFKYHQFPHHPFKNHGGLQIMMEQGHVSRNVGLQYKIFTPYGTLSAIVKRGPNMEKQR